MCGPPRRAAANRFIRETPRTDVRKTDLGNRRQLGAAGLPDFSMVYRQRKVGATVEEFIYIEREIPRVARFQIAHPNK